MPYQETGLQIEANQQQLEDTWRFAETSLGRIFPDRELFRNDPDHNVPTICSFATRPSGRRDIVQLQAIVSEFVDYRMIADLLESRGTHLLEVTTTHDPKIGTRGMSFGIYTYGEFTHGTVRLLLQDVGGRKAAYIQCETGYNDAGSYTRKIVEILGYGPKPQGFPLVELLGIVIPVDISITL